MSGYRGGSYYVKLVAILIAFYGAAVSGGWVNKATNIETCPGRTITFPWAYDEVANHLVGFSIYKSGVPPTTMLTREGNGTASPKLPRIQFLPNAGMILSDVRAADQGEYQISAVFDNETNNLAGNATLHVLSDCPDHEALMNPNVTFNLKLDADERKNIIENTTCDMKTFLRTIEVDLSTTVPQARPEVRAIFQLDDTDRGVITQYNCSGKNDSDSVCSQKLQLKDYGNFVITVLLEHDGYANETISTLYECRISDKRYDNIHLAIIIISIFVVLVILVFCICLICRCCIKRRKKTLNPGGAPRGKSGGKTPEGEEAPMVDQRSRPTSKSPPPLQETESLADSVDPYSCTCGFCPQTTDGYCCNEIATLNNLLDSYSQKCITQAMHFRSICHKISISEIPPEEKFSAAKQSTGHWIWHTPKTSGFPACVESHLARDFPEPTTAHTPV